MTPVPDFLDALVDAFTTATTATTPAVSVVHSWGNVYQGPGAVFVGGLDPEASQALDFGALANAVTTDRTRSGFGGEQVEQVSVTCSLTVPPADDDEPSTVAANTGAILNLLSAALRPLPGDVDRLTTTWVQSTAWTLPDQAAGFAAFVIFTVVGEFHL